MLPDAQITARETVDNDSDGQLDHIKITVDNTLNDDFSDLMMTVAGYGLDPTTPYITNIGSGGANDDVFYVKLVEPSTPDTAATPTVQVTANTNLFGGGTALVTDGGVAATDKAAPAESGVDSSTSFT